ncbi:DUF192 domain-containing protein [Halomonas sp. BC04]|uniref:DUF192 domain-containing protein n=1 Tax=Halomonas sp. BC04 TaxID=1403540 RepID=UPI0003ED7632|nr:DUF192 domain-containing protein [Halomonas sp. BC04]EWH02495.1 hypothetical protein Q427_08390 [Halomonas sp. BC04]
MHPLQRPVASTRTILLVLLLAVAATLTWRWPAVAESTTSLERQPLLIKAGQEVFRLEVEMARTADERRIGLMDRDSLAPDAGMLFLYERIQPPRSGFWMYRTRIPLDIAFIDVHGRIATIHTMVPCPSENPRECPATLAGAYYQAALEVNAGYFTERGIEPGACVDWPGRLDGCSAAK